VHSLPLACGGCDTDQINLRPGDTVCSLRTLIVPRYHEFKWRSLDMCSAATVAQPVIRNGIVKY